MAAEETMSDGLAVSDGRTGAARTLVGTANMPCPLGALGLVVSDGRTLTEGTRAAAQGRE